MKALVAVAFLATPATALLAAIVGVRALMQPVVDRKRLMLAAALVAAPWIFVVLFAGAYAGEFVEAVVKGPLAVSPLVAVGLAGGASLRWRIEIAASVRTSFNQARSRVASIWRSLTFAPSQVAALRFPHLKHAAVALLVVMPILWLFGREGRSSGHSNPIGGLAGQILLATATLIGTAVSIVLAVIAVIRPGTAVAVAYSWLALATAAGLTVLWGVGYWEEAARTPYLHYWFAPALMWMGAAACVPALAAHVLSVYRNRGELKDDFVDWVYRMRR